MVSTPIYTTLSLPSKTLSFMYNLSMENKISAIHSWLGSGAINIFGIQFSGKDTLGVPLAERLGAKFISSGDLVRAAMHNSNDSRIQQAALDTQTGILTPTDEFRQLIVPHLKDDRLSGIPLVLGSVGRWIGEEEVVMTALAEGGHPLHAVIVLDIPEEEVWRRWEVVKNTRNGGRQDDQDRSRVAKRLQEFKEKTVPVITKYASLGIVINIDATGTIEDTFNAAIDGLYRRAIIN